MNQIEETDLSKIAGMSFACSCGRNHSVDIKRLIIGSDITDEIVEIAGDFRGGKIFLFADSNTYRILGQKVEEKLKTNQLNVKSYLFHGEQTLVPDERALGRLLVEIDKDTSVILAVGSGTVNDLARMMSYKMDIPYIIIGTAPSMDGYASTVSPLLIEGFKATYEAVYPYAILLDLDILKEAPMHMLQAGFGDVLGKYTALADWELSRKMNQEYFCDTSAKLVKNALQKCVDHVDGIARRKKEAIQYLTEALILSGIAMGLVRNSRPASGSEHHLAHFWEMDAHAKHLEHPLHGNSVGVGTTVVSTIYWLLKSRFKLEVEVPKPETIREMLDRLGACNNPKDLGISREVFKDSILKAMNIRPRYTVFHFAKQNGLLEELAERLTCELY